MAAEADRQLSGPVETGRRSAVSQSTQEADTLILINIFMDHQAERDQNQMFRGTVCSV